MSALLAALLAAAPGCPAALAAAAATPAAALPARAGALVEALEQGGAGGPTTALAASAAALAAAAGDPPAARDAAAAAFRGGLARHCALAAAPPMPEASAEDRAALAEVLARPELSRARSDPYALRRALARFWDWLVELLGTEEAERYASLGRALFLGVAAAAIALLAAGLRRRHRERDAPRGGAAEGVPARPAAADQSAALADEALRRGDGRGAVRFALLAALGALERAGRVPRGRALTNGELAAAVGGDDLPALTRAFDRAVYGGLPVTPDEARDAVERARRAALAAGGAP